MFNYPFASSMLVMFVTSAFTASVFSADGTITINGKITDTTCLISVNDGTHNATVTLPTVSITTLGTVGARAGATPFTISLKNCEVATLKQASTYFEPGQYVDSTSGRLNIDKTPKDAATNVQVELLDVNYNPIVIGAPVANPLNNVTVDISSKSGILKYFAQYYATGKSTVGAVKTQVDYTIIYE